MASISELMRGKTPGTVKVRYPGWEKGRFFRPFFTDVDEDWCGLNQGTFFENHQNGAMWEYYDAAVWTDEQSTTEDLIKEFHKKTAEDFREFARCAPSDEKSERRFTAAVAAMQGMIAKGNCDLKLELALRHSGDAEGMLDELARGIGGMAVRYADALLKELGDK